MEEAKYDTHWPPELHFLVYTLIFVLVTGVAEYLEAEERGL